MRNIRHHAIVVTAQDKKFLEKLHKETLTHFDQSLSVRIKGFLVSPLVSSFINDYHSFLIAPDGSKEGYDTSEEADLARRSYLDRLEEIRKNEPERDLHFVEVLYGADNDSAALLRASQ